MGVSTNGQICFGIQFDEDFEFPWGDEKYLGEIEEWWLDISDYQNPFEIYDSNGEWLNGVEPSEEKIDKYYEQKRDFFKEHPMPVELVNCCSLDYPEYILAVPSSVKTAYRGDPKEINPEKLKVSHAEESALIDFCKKFCPSDYLLTGKWYLSSFWG